MPKKSQMATQLRRLTIRKLHVITIFFFLNYIQHNWNAGFDYLVNAMTSTTPLLIGSYSLWRLSALFVFVFFKSGLDFVVYFPLTSEFFFFFKLKKKGFHFRFRREFADTTLFSGVVRRDRDAANVFQMNKTTQSANFSPPPFSSEFLVFFFFNQLIKKI